MGVYVFIIHEGHEVCYADESYWCKLFGHAPLEGGKRFNAKIETAIRFHDDQGGSYRKQNSIGVAIKIEM